MGWNEQKPNPMIPSRFQSVSSKCVTYCFANSCRAACSSCCALSSAVNRSWTYEQALLVWNNVYYEHGPCHIIFAGLEPLEEPEFVGSILKLHNGYICTNLMVEVGVLRGSVDPSAVFLNASFHPHLWDNLGEFLLKLRKLRDSGYESVVALVGYPQYLPRWSEWIDEIQNFGFGYAVNPLVVDGSFYSYSDEHQAILDKYLPKDASATLNKSTTQAIREGVHCAAGHVYCYVDQHMRVRRCPSHEGTCDFVAEGGLHFTEEPELCQGKDCNCFCLRCYIL